MGIVRAHIIMLETDLSVEAEVHGVALVDIVQFASQKM